MPILFYFRCKITFTPKTDPVEGLIMIPKACPNRHCRSQTLNIPDAELEIIRKTQNRNLMTSPSYHTGIKKSVPVLDKYKPKKKEKIPLVTCVECEIFYHDEESLKRHQCKRHHGMCRKCHSSNVYVMRIDDETICKPCFESKKSSSKKISRSK